MILELHTQTLQSDCPFSFITLSLPRDLLPHTDLPKCCMYLFETIADALKMCGPSIFLIWYAKKQQTKRWSNHVGTEQHGWTCHCSFGALRRSGEVKYGILGRKKRLFLRFLLVLMGFVCRKPQWKYSFRELFFSVFSHMLNLENKWHWINCFTKRISELRTASCWSPLLCFSMRRYHVYFAYIYIYIYMFWRHTRTMSPTNVLVVWYSRSAFFQGEIVLSGFQCWCLQSLGQNSGQIEIWSILVPFSLTLLVHFQQFHYSFISLILLICLLNSFTTFGGRWTSSASPTPPKNSSCHLEIIHSFILTSSHTCPFPKETFLVSYFSTKLPVKVRQGCHSWPAIRSVQATG